MAQGQYSNIRIVAAATATVRSTAYGCCTLFDITAVQVVVLVQAHMRLKNWVDGGGVGITIRNEPRKTVLTRIPISGGEVGNVAG